jgi:hypothetical protein
MLPTCTDQSVDSVYNSFVVLVSAIKFAHRPVISIERAKFLIRHIEPCGIRSDNLHTSINPVSRMTSGNG